jgi:hypothetical protein
VLTGGRGVDIHDERLCVTQSCVSTVFPLRAYLVIEVIVL